MVSMTRITNKSCVQPLASLEICHQSLNFMEKCQKTPKEVKFYGPISRGKIFFDKIFPQFYFNSEVNKISKFEALLNRSLRKCLFCLILTKKWILTLLHREKDKFLKKELKIFDGMSSLDVTQILLKNYKVLLFIYIFIRFGNL